eukprot:EG_transcript_3610
MTPTCDVQPPEECMKFWPEADFGGGETPQGSSPNSMGHTSASSCLLRDPDSDADTGQPATPTSQCGPGTGGWAGVPEPQSGTVLEDFVLGLELEAAEGNERAAVERSWCRTRVALLEQLKLALEQQMALDVQALLSEETVFRRSVESLWEAITRSKFQAAQAELRRLPVATPKPIPASPTPVYCPRAAEAHVKLCRMRNLPRGEMRYQCLDCGAFWCANCVGLQLPQYGLPDGTLGILCDVCAQ